MSIKKIKNGILSLIFLEHVILLGLSMGMSAPSILLNPTVAVSSHSGKPSSSSASLAHFFSGKHLCFDFSESRRLSFRTSIFMGPTTTAPGDALRNVYSVWALPPPELAPRLKKLMDGLRSEFGGPQFEPHVTVVGAISLTESEAREKFERACEGVKAYDARVEKVATGTFFYQCVFLLLHPTPQVVDASAHCCTHFGFKNSTPYMPHLSLLYGDLSDEVKKIAQEKAYALDDTIGSLNFKISRLALYKTDTEDKTCQSWEKIAECQLKSE